MIIINSYVFTLNVLQNKKVPISVFFILQNTKIKKNQSQFFLFWCIVCLDRASSKGKAKKKQARYAKGKGINLENVSNMDQTDETTYDKYNDVIEGITQLSDFYLLFFGETKINFIWCAIVVW